MTTKTDDWQYQGEKTDEELEALELLFTTAHSSCLEDRETLDKAEKVLQECIVLARAWRNMGEDLKEKIKKADRRRGEN